MGGLMATYAKALEFDGANDYVDCGNDSSLRITNNWSVSCWVYCGSQVHTTDFIGRWEASGDNRSWVIGFGPGAGKEKRLRIAVSDDGTYDATHARDVYSNYDVMWEGWRFVAVTWASGTLSAWVDADPITSWVTTSAGAAVTASHAGTASLTFGGVDTTFAAVSMCNVAVYDTDVLVQADVDALMNADSPLQGASFGGHATLPTGCVGYWQMDGDYTDELGTNDMATSSSVPTVTTGKINGAYHFGGLQKLTKLSPTGLPSGSSARTFNAWIKFDTTTGGAHAVGGWGTNSSYRAFRVAHIGSSGGAVAHTMALDLANEAVFVEMDPSRANRWIMLTATMSGTGKAYKFYINATLVASGSFTNTPNTGATEVTAGGVVGAPGTSDWWRGDLDEFGIWNRELSADEIAELWGQRNNQDPATATYSGAQALVSSWLWNGAITYDTVQDNSGASDGTMINMASGDIVDSPWEYFDPGTYVAPEQLQVIT